MSGGSPMNTNPVADPYLELILSHIRVISKNYYIS
jgi:hypothetical protein